MKKDNNYLTFLWIIFVILIFGCQKKAHLLSLENDRLEVAFTNTMDFRDLVQIKNELDKKGISLDYKFMEFKDNGELKSLEFRVDCHDGFSGSAKNNYIGRHPSFGFYRDYSKNARTAFGTGGVN